MTTRRLFLAKLAGLAGFTLLSRAKADYTKPLSLPVVVPRGLGKQNLSWEDVVDYNRLLYCISAVETQHQDHLIGPSGERSRYQIKRSVWEQHWGKKRPFSRCKGEAAWGTAHDHLGWLVAETTTHNSVYWLAYAWRAGITRQRRATVEAPVHPTYHSYSKRVDALYLDPTYKHT
jgi:hypothetical protein